MTALIRPGPFSRGTRLRGQHVEVTLKTIDHTDFSFKVFQGNNLFQALASKNPDICFSISVYTLGTTEIFFGSYALK